MDLSLVLACYRDEAQLVRNVQSIQNYLAATNLAYEIVFVEDASPDATAVEVRAAVAWLQSKQVPTSAIFHAENRGRGKSVQGGMLVAKGRVVAYVDVDLENVLDGLLPSYLKIRDREADVIVGKRHFEKRKVRLIRWIVSAGYRFLRQRVMSLPVSDTEAGFKVFARDAILPILPRMENEGWFWDTEIVVRAVDAGLKVCEHPIIFLCDQDKQSTVSVFRDSWTHFMDLARFVYSRKRSRRKGVNSVSASSVAK